MPDLTNELLALLSPENQATILQILMATSLLMPVFERLAARTKTDIDDRIVAIVQKLLSLVPRVRLGGQK